MKYLLLDVAGTLLHKPSFYKKIQAMLKSEGYDIDEKTIKYHHKILSESFHFPDRTNELFYKSFNRELLYSFGIIPSDIQLERIFKECSYLPWEKFEDVQFLREIELPIGIISNFNSTLKEKLQMQFDLKISDIFVSEELGVAKPSLEFYQQALNIINIEPSEIIYIGDSVKLDLEPARKLGINTFLIDRENFFPSQKYRINSFSELKNLISK